MQTGLSYGVKQMEKNKPAKKWVLWVVSSAVAIMLICAAMTVLVDPFFHYHAPIWQYSYPSEASYYTNDGILKNLDYSAIITGTSMTENFKVSEAEALFGGSFVKVPLSGASLKEVSDQLYRAYASGKSPDLVIRGLDISYLHQGEDFSYHDYSDMEYLFNDVFIDDVNYFLNCTVFFDHVLPAVFSAKTPMRQVFFDTYCAWNFETGRTNVLNSYAHSDKTAPEKPLTGEEKEILLGNIRQNAAKIAAEHPETTFYYFFTPYSICSWDEYHADGTIGRRIEAEKLAAAELLKYPNIKLFSFWSDHDVICDLNNYVDSSHYAENVNSAILSWMSEGKYQLTGENYLRYYNEAEDFFRNYDYSQFGRDEE